LEVFCDFKFQHVGVSGSGVPLNVSTAYLLNIFLVPLQQFTVPSPKVISLSSACASQARGAPPFCGGPRVS
jgi:hypothetical protein